MTIARCPSNCDHEFSFLHTLVTTKRYIFVVCGECDHWISRKPSCSCRCHQEDGGIAKRYPDQVECL
jgi:hypothetical protein